MIEIDQGIQQNKEMTRVKLTKIEMLSFVYFDFDLDREWEVSFNDRISQYLVSPLNDSQRVINGLSNLQSFQCKQLTCIARNKFLLRDYLSLDIFYVGQY